MSEAGYTLVETLAAMAVISLAMGALVLGVQVLSPSESATGRTALRLQLARSTEARFEALLARGAPFDASNPEELSGDDQTVRFSCNAPQPCRAELSHVESGSTLKLYDGRGDTPALTLSAPASARFAYRGMRSEARHWPPDETGPQVLRSIALLTESESDSPPLLEMRVWREQTADCAFDPIAGTCRHE